MLFLVRLKSSSIVVAIGAKLPYYLADLTTTQGRIRMATIISSGSGRSRSASIGRSTTDKQLARAGGRIIELEAKGDYLVYVKAEIYYDN
jgi:hypothetical protein